ncbi:MAG: hypothetical protein GKS02_07310 [Alphaproteobacteria bacterium]|nr:hypothetical protein [Alphaproteobacteria bacterium]
MLSKWFGSDVYLAYTAAYTWQSNQTAHAMMGFTGTTLLTSGAIAVDLSPLYGLSFLVIPLWKDFTDLLLDRGRAQSGGGVKYFPVKMRELISDALTDSFFWSLGTVLALAIILQVPEVQAQSAAKWFIGIFVIMLVVALAWPRRYYLKEKNAFDRTGLPYYFRLPNFDGSFLDADDAPIISNFIDDPDRKQHLIICGPNGSRKTTLAAGIGSGLTITRSLKVDPPAVRYISAAKLIEELAVSANPQTRQDEPYSVFNADVLIIDDLPQMSAIMPQPGGAGPTPDWEQLLKTPSVWTVSNEADVPAWENWITNHKPADMAVEKIALGSIQSNPVAQQYSVLKLQWQGLFPLLGIAIPLALAAAAIWGLYTCTPPKSAFIRFAGFGLAAALIAEIVWTFFLKREPD